MEEIYKESKKFKIYLLIGLILLVVLIMPKSRNAIFSVFDNSQNDLQLVNSIPIDSPIKAINVYDESIVRLKDNSLYFLDFNGKELSKKDFKFKESSIFFGEEIIYVFEKASGKIILLDKAGETLENIDLKLDFTRLEEEGENILIFRKDEEDEDKDLIDLIDRKGNLLVNHQENIPILTVSVEDKKIDYLVATLDVNKGLKTLINTYSQSGQEIFKLDLKDEIVIFSEFIKNDLLIASQKSLYLLKDDQIKWEKKYKDLKDVKLVGKEIFLLYGDKFEILNLRGGVKKEIELDKYVEKIVTRDGETLLYSSNDIIIPRNKKNRLEFMADTAILDVKASMENIFIFKEDKIERYNIIKKGEK